MESFEINLEIFRSSSSKSVNFVRGYLNLNVGCLYLSTFALKYLPDFTNLYFAQLYFMINNVKKLDRNIKCHLFDS